jgi:hypothetical protein
MKRFVAALLLASAVFAASAATRADIINQLPAATGGADTAEQLETIIDVTSLISRPVFPRAEQGGASSELDAGVNIEATANEHAAATPPGLSATSEIAAMPAGAYFGALSAGGAQPAELEPLEVTSLRDSLFDDPIILGAVIVGVFGLGLVYRVARARLAGVGRGGSLLDQLDLKPRAEPPSFAVKRHAAPSASSSGRRSRRRRRRHA